MIEAVVLGRVGVDLTPAEPRTSLAAPSSFVRAVGGFAGNISTGLARLGIETAVISAVGDDGHGEHVRAALTSEGIDVGAIATKAGRRTQVAFFEAWPPDDFPVTFHRSSPAPETLLAPADLPAALIDEARIVIVSGALLAEEPTRSTVLDALDRRAIRGASRDRTERSWTILDLDWRPTLWPNPAALPELIARAARACNVIVGGDAEFAAVGLRPEDAATPLPGTRTERLVVLKHGPAGVSLLSADGRRSLPGIAVEVLCGLGSGDALTAAFAAGLLRELDPLAALERGNAAGAIVATRLMCSTAMPRPDEIDALLVRSGPGAAAGTAGGSR